MYSITNQQTDNLLAKSCNVADIIVGLVSGGKENVLDITVVNPLQTAFIHQSSEVPGLWRLMHG